MDPDIEVPKIPFFQTEAPIAVKVVFFRIALTNYKQI